MSEGQPVQSMTTEEVAVRFPGCPASPPELEVAGVGPPTVTLGSSSGLSQESVLSGVSVRARRARIEQLHPRAPDAAPGGR